MCALTFFLFWFAFSHKSGESGEALLRILTIQAFEMRLKNLSLLSSLLLHGFSSEFGLLADSAFG